MNSPALKGILKKVKAKQAEAVKDVTRNEKNPRALGRFKRLAKAGVTGAANNSDIQRIMELPLQFPMTEQEREDFNRQYLLADAYNAGMRFLPAQPDAILQYLKYKGAFLPIAVGGGKTLTSLTIADHAYRAGRRRIFLMLPPNIVPQLIGPDIKFARSMVPISFPIHVMHGKSRKERAALAKRRPQGVYIFPYSLLSQQDAEELLFQIAPETVICDEAHCISNDDAARTKRFSRYANEYNPELVAMSGTLTSKSLKEYRHLLRWSLKENSPIPFNHSELTDWCEAIDATADDFAIVGRDSQRKKAYSMRQLTEWAASVTGQKFGRETSDFRKAYQVRLKTCPGVFSTSESSVGTSLTMHNIPVPDGYQGTPDYEQLQDHLARLEGEWLTPNGDEIEFAMQKYKWEYELASGFYNKLVWPSVEEYAERRGISQEAAADILKRAQEHHERHQEYAKLLRQYLKHPRPRLDTPMLVGSHFAHHKGPGELDGLLYKKWQAWKDADFDGRPDRDSIPVRVCDYKVQHALQWCLNNKIGKGRGGIVWVHNIELGKWMYDEARAAGLDCLLCPAGDEANAAIIDHDNGGRLIIASISAHGTGKNLQHFQEQFFLQWPRPAKVCEQVLGRLHRTGQKADNLVVNTCFTQPFDHMLFAASLNDALYIQQTLGSQQKLLIADYDPTPEIFEGNILEERGFDPRPLSHEAIRLRMAKFGEL